MSQNDILDNNDFWIFTAKQEELNRVLATFRNSRCVTMVGDKIIGPGDGSSYYPGEIRLRNEPGNESVKFALTSGYRQGPQSFGIFASRVLTAHPADHALMVGICAGDPAKGVKLGHVIFACKSFNYEEGKRKEGDDGGEEFNPEYEAYQTAPGVENEVTHFVGKENRPDYKKSPMISGASVQENAAKVFQQCQKGSNRKIAALDMESSAFFEACDHCQIKALPVIKAVSDTGDQTKSDSHHEVVLEKAADAAIRFIEHFFDVPGCRRSTASKDKTEKRSGSTITGHEVKKIKVSAGLCDGVDESNVVTASAAINITEQASDNLLHDLSGKLGREWETFALKLGFKQDELELIKDEKTTNQDKAKDILRSWKRSNGKEKGATEAVLVTALKKAGLSSLVNFVAKHTD